VISLISSDLNLLKLSMNGQKGTLHTQFLEKFGCRYHFGIWYSLTTRPNGYRSMDRRSRGQYRPFAGTIRPVNKAKFTYGPFSLLSKVIHQLHYRNYQWTILSEAKTKAERYNLLYTIF